MQVELPTGTVTFLFTDVEGSTRLLDELGEVGYAEALQSHRAVIRDALAEHGGAEVDTQGDAFFCVFPSARAAVACAESVQSSLAAGPIRVRIGVHTGEALLVDRHYVGMDVHRAARIGACGHGGQVVVSPSTAALLDGSFELEELGAHRLKDLSAPVLLYQLGDADFGPLKTLFRTNLPVPATPFLGREAELQELVQRASSPEVRLLTLTGPGGTGKTRFALQLAAELADGFPDGVRWVPLASLREPELVPSAVAQALEVQEEPGQELATAIARSLAGKRVLLLLDNCEHVLDAVAGMVVAALESGPGVLVVATSREPLSLGAEHVYGVQPLRPTDAVSLFDSRARAVGAAVDSPESRDAIEKLCARLDHLPLAVELAAARTAALPPAALLERLSTRIDVLQGPRDAEARQRTLRATIAWSYDLLEESEQRVFRRFAIFAGGASLEAVETACEADLDELLSLVAKSLVRQAETPGGEARYWMLETIREFAASELEESGEAGAHRDRHLSWFAGLAREAVGRIVGPGSTVWLGRLEQDLENLRAASRRALERAEAAGATAFGEAGEDAVSLSSVLAPLHLLHGRYAECEELIRRTLELGPDARQAALLQSRLGRVLRQRGRPEEALETHLAAEALLESLPERDAAWWEAWITVKLQRAHHLYFQGDRAALGRVIDELQPHVDKRGTPQQGLDFLHVLAQDAYRRERYALSAETEELVRTIYRRSLELEDVDADFTLGFCLVWRGKLDEAAAAFQQGLASARERGDALIEARCLVYGLVAERLRGEVEAARALLQELEALDDFQGYDGLVRANAAWLAYRAGEFDTAASFATEAFEEWSSEARSGATVFQWTARFPMLAIELARGDAQAALEHARRMLDQSQQPLPDELRAILTQAVEEGSAALLAGVVERARATGHA